MYRYPSLGGHSQQRPPPPPPIPDVAKSFVSATMNAFPSPSHQRPPDLSNVATISWQMGLPIEGSAVLPDNALYHLRFPWIFTHIQYIQTSLVSHG